MDDAAIKSRAMVTIASDIAPELDRCLREWLGSDMIPGSKEHKALTQCLWDNKIGLLRCAEHISRPPAAPPTATPETKG